MAVICKRCGVRGLVWRESANTRTGVQLYQQDGKPHECKDKYGNPLYHFNTYNEELAYFLNNLVIWDKDPIGLKRVKMQRQRRLMWVPTEQERKTMEENFKKYDAFYRAHTFTSK